MGGLGRRLHHDLSDGIIRNRIKMGKFRRLSTMDARGQRWIAEINMKTDPRECKSFNL